jgi:hypothetical protein
MSANSKPTPEELSALFPRTCRPFAVWYNPEECFADHLTGCHWVVNGDGGLPEEEFEELATALKKAAQMGSEWDADARRQAQALAKIGGHESTEESRAGATACLNALRVIENINKEPSTTYWQDKSAGIASMLNSVGAQSDFVSGFVAAFAEYAHFIESTGIPDLHIWKPESTMTTSEIAANRALIEAE